MAKKKSTQLNKSTKKEVKPAPISSSYLRFGESYTSLILGIIVVIVATVLVLGLLRNRNLNQANNLNLTEQTQPGFQNTVSQTVTTAPTQAVAPTLTPTLTLTPTAAPTPTPTKKVTVNSKENVYTVKAGDTLWTISEKQYKSGYNWVDIARANKLSNSDVLNTGDKLIIPKVAKKTAESEPDIYGNDFSQQTSSISTMRGEEKITVDKYVVKLGDSLWSISLRSYGDGYRWVDIAKANNLANPDIINEGTSLKLPRK